ncbi:hypothetical protein BDZ85DRAFT_265504 [Elsinoe ampelina]|uniref:Uncharacterized protein n=1 Tax=Elsinoe ampelina TaxID=302913 RepID=A0A6A6G7F8_9PEZI|nr:hypothetical protein BDZ85DRAFT_265504 [Elsinoe ampelina]
MSQIHQNGIRRSVLVWTWIPRCIICVILLGFAIRGYVVLESMYDDTSSKSDWDTVLDGSFGIIAAFTAGTIVLDLIEAVLLAIQKLHPVALLVSNIIKFIMWAFYLTALIVAMVIASSFSATIFPVVLLLALTIASLTYSSMLVHHRRMDKKQAANISKHGAATEIQDA